MSHLTFSILAFSSNFGTFKSDLYGKTVKLQASMFLKTRQKGPFWAFSICSLKMSNVARFARNFDRDFW